MTQRDMAHFMVDHALNFVVGHHIHQSVVDADTTVRHGKRVDVPSSRKPYSSPVGR